MKNTIFIIALLVSSISFSQNLKATTEEGKSVILKTDNTWSYTDGAETKEEGCNLGKDFKQSKVNNGLLKHVMVDTNSNADEIIFMKSNTSLGGGNWLLCVKGKQMSYKRVGSVFMKSGDNPF
ncbi:hypothetical protein [Xanthomarina sp.]|uniref:hypothetical protein n=1 Tax=Xanthomarina sp. TaxID=1931211 RepID=UPI002C29E49C|nr:hypothetical protein [Xanthomarina sp.]HLV40630.1 hypothetical protein [Xanthomarina sp.]